MQSYQRFQHIGHTASTPPAQTPQRSFQRGLAGTHATPAPNRAHSGSQGETGSFWMGRYHYPRTVSHGSETLRGRVSERQTSPLLGLGRVCSRRAQRAFGTAMRSCASLFRGAAAPLGCVIPLLFLLPLTVLLSCFVGTQKIERLFFSYSGAFFEPLFESIHARNLSLGQRSGCRF